MENEHLDGSIQAGAPPAQDAFRHQALKLDEPQIRLLKLRKAQSSGNQISVYCTIDVFNLESCPAYHALSYAWGDVSLLCRIRMNGRIHEISKNLHDFLLIAVHRFPNTFFWIDQLSINQANLLERNHQVRQMDMIYTQSFRVIAWLGNRPTGDEVDYPSLKDVFHHIDHAGARDLTLIYEMLECCDYWKRLWILQELHFARQVVILFGTTEMSFSELRAGIRRVCRNAQSGWYLDRMPSPHHQGWSIRESVSALLELILLNVSSRPCDDTSNIDPWSGDLSKSTIKDVSVCQPELKDTEPSHHGIYPLDYALGLFSGHLCKDPRDKVLGLQSLVMAKRRIPVEYSKTPEQVFLLTTLSLIRHSADLIDTGFFWSYKHSFTKFIRAISAELVITQKLLTGQTPYETLWSILVRREHGLEVERNLRSLFFALKISTWPFVLDRLQCLRPGGDWWRQACLTLVRQAVTSDERRLAELLACRIAKCFGCTLNFHPFSRARDGAMERGLQEDDVRHSVGATNVKCASSLTKTCPYCFEGLGRQPEKKIDFRRLILASISDCSFLIIDRRFGMSIVDGYDGVMRFGDLVVHRSDPLSALLEEVYPGEMF